MFSMFYVHIFERMETLEHHVFFSRSPVSQAYTVMATVTTVLKAVGLFVAELISSFTDWFQTKPAWANLQVLENTELKTTGGSESNYSRRLLTCRHAAFF